MVNNKFLSIGGSNISNGTAVIFGASIGAQNLEPNRPVKTNSDRVLTSTNLDIDDTNNLRSELDVKNELDFTLGPIPPVPDSNKITLFADDSGTLFTIDSAGNLTELGSASESNLTGRVNTLENKTQQITYDAILNETLLNGSRIVNRDELNIVANALNVDIDNINDRTQGVVYNETTNRTEIDGQNPILESQYNQDQQTQDQQIIDLQTKTQNLQYNQTTGKTELDGENIILETQYNQQQEAQDDRLIGLESKTQGIDYNQTTGKTEIDGENIIGEDGLQLILDPIDDSIQELTNKTVNIEVVGGETRIDGELKAGTQDLLDFQVAQSVRDGFQDGRITENERKLAFVTNEGGVPPQDNTQKLIIDQPVQLTGTGGSLVGIQFDGPDIQNQTTAPVPPGFFFDSNNDSVGLVGDDISFITTNQNTLLSELALKTDIPPPQDLTELQLKTQNIILGPDGTEQNLTVFKKDVKLLQNLDPPVSAADRYSSFVGTQGSTITPDGRGGFLDTPSNLATQSSVEYTDIQNYIDDPKIPHRISFDYTITSTQNTNLLELRYGTGNDSIFATFTRNLTLNNTIYTVERSDGAGNRTLIDTAVLPPNQNKLDIELNFVDLTNSSLIFYDDAGILVKETASFVNVVSPEVVRILSRSSQNNPVQIDYSNFTSSWIEKEEGPDVEVVVERGEFKSNKIQSAPGTNFSTGVQNFGNIEQQEMISLRALEDYKAKVFGNKQEYSVRFDATIANQVLFENDEIIVTWNVVDRQPQFRYKINYGINQVIVSTCELWIPGSGTIISNDSRSDAFRMDGPFATGTNYFHNSVISNFSLRSLGPRFKCTVTREFPVQSNFYSVEIWGGYTVQTDPPNKCISVVRIY